MTYLDLGISESLNLFGRTVLSFPNVSFLNIHLSALYQLLQFLYPITYASTKIREEKKKKLIPTCFKY